MNMIVRQIGRFLGCASLLVGLRVSGLGQTADVGADARLQKPLSIKLKIVSLPAALKQISKLEGVKLENVATISDLKITVFVDGVPAGSVLQKIASVLGCQWKADGELWRLTVEPDARIARDRYITAEDDAARKEIEAELNKLAQAGASSQQAETVDNNGQQAIQLDLASTAQSADSEHSGAMHMAQIQQNSTLGRFLSTMDASKVASFWRGDVVFGRLIDQRTGSDTVNQNGESVRRTRRPPPATSIFVQYDPLLYQVHVASGGGERVIAMRSEHLITQFRPVDALAKLPFGVDVLAWDQAIPTDSDLAKLQIGQTQKVPSYADRRLNVADFLENAFEQTHVPIVADAFRLPAAGTNINRGVGPFLSWLKALKQDNHLYTRIEDGVLMVRHPGFWRLRKFETPEDVLAPIEAKAAAGRATLDDYASFVAKLTPEQAKPFCIAEGSATVFSNRPIQVAYPALLFYASLGSRELDVASTSGIACTRLGAAQVQLFEAAALESVFYGASNGGFTAELGRLADTGDTRGLGFLMRKDTMPVNGVISDGEAMLFGVNLNQAAIYKIPLAP